MRILEVVFCGTIGTQFMGPVSNDILQLSNRFAARGHDVTVVDLATPEPRELLHPDVELVEVSGVSETSTASSPRTPPPRNRATQLAQQSPYRMSHRLAAQGFSRGGRGPLPLGGTAFHCPKGAWFADVLHLAHSGVEPRARGAHPTGVRQALFTTTMVTVVESSPGRQVRTMLATTRSPPNDRVLQDAVRTQFGKYHDGEVLNLL